jgi:hypothetical protein
MRIFKRRSRRPESGGTATAERGHRGVGDEFHGSDEELAAEIAATRTGHGPESARRLLALRHVAGTRALASAAAAPAFPEPETDRLPEEGELPEFRADELTPGLVRAAILRDGCILVRGLVDRAEALRFADGIDTAFAERERVLDGGEAQSGHYEEFVPETPEYLQELTAVRPWIREGGGVLAVDSPPLCAEMVDLFERTGISRLAAGYLGERPLISLQKTTLRKAEPHVAGAWHQDGSFMGDVRALNLWLSLSRCGDESPGLDLVPRRLEHLVQQQTDEAVLEIQVSQRLAEEAAGDRAIVRPVFEPGDALFFDDLFLHKTGSDPSMPKPRFAIENWFFGASAFPREYGPLAV